MLESLGIEISPINKMVGSEGSKQPLWLKELRDLARGLSGALLIALPLLYTLEMWNRAALMPHWMLLVGLVAAYVANAGYIVFSGFKPEKDRLSIFLDAVTALGIGFIASLITLILIGRYDFDSQFNYILKIALLETIPTSFGASLAINQLGARKQDSKGKSPAEKLHPDLRKLFASVLGALLFSFNIAPTIEPKLITYTISWWHTIALMIFTIALSVVIVYFADFVDRGNEGGMFEVKWLETAVAYLISLAVSLGLLWFFGFINNGTPVSIAVPWIITMGYVTSLGSSAGRLIL